MIEEKEAEVGAVTNILSNLDEALRVRFGSLEDKGKPGYTMPLSVSN